MSPLGLVSLGMARVRSTSIPLGCRPQVSEIMEPPVFASGLNFLRRSSCSAQHAASWHRLLDCHVFPGYWQDVASIRPNVGALLHGDAFFQ
jgi:hypothetical protein